MPKRDRKPEKPKLTKKEAEKIVWREIDVEELKRRTPETHRLIEEMLKAGHVSSQTLKREIDI